MKFNLNRFLESGCLLSFGLDEFWVGWGLPVRSEVSRAEGLSVYSPDFFLEDACPWFQFPFFKKMTRRQLLRELSRSEAASVPELKWSSPHFEIFQNAFLDLKRRFQSGSLTKAVPIIFEYAHQTLEGGRLVGLLTHLLFKTQDLPLFPYGIWYPGETGRAEGMLGATPEVLCRLGADRVLHTVALAGTRIRNSLGLTPLPLLGDLKELREHQIVLDGIARSLESFGEMSFGQTQELILPTLSHLLTPITLSLHPEIDDSEPFFEKVVRALHPTPALGAFPREEGLLWLKDYQKQIDRGRFGAPFGFALESGEIFCVVSIRNIQWKNSQVSLGAGCGIISESQIDREWSELQGKLLSVKQYLGEFQGS